MVRVFEVQIGDQKLRIEVEGLTPAQRVVAAIEQGAGMMVDPAELFLDDWLRDNLERADFPTPFRTIYQAYVEDVKRLQARQMTANRMSRHMTARYGKGRNAWIAETRKVVPGVMARLKNR